MAALAGSARAGVIAALLLAAVQLPARADPAEGELTLASTDEDADEEPEWKFFPLPLYATTPNEGSTYGGMPVFLRVSGDGVVQLILAPSVSWNDSAGLSGTFRLYRFFDRVRSAMVIASASTRINRTLWLEYAALPTEPGRPTIEAVAKVRRNLFFRFFGFGPDSREEDESSYTKTTALLGARLGWNVAPHVNVGLRLSLRRDSIEEHAIEGLPTVQAAHPAAPGLGGAAQAAQLLSIRYDTRDGGDYATSGVAVELSGGRVGVLRGFDDFWQLTLHARVLVEESPRVQGAARLLIDQQIGGNNVPFYYQAALGGEVLFRGYPEDRFVDRGAWEAELEQRIQLFQTNIFGVTTDWRVDPFVAVGQVYHTPSEAFSRVRIAAGVGLRAWVRPNILGRVDVAYSTEGLRIYVVLGYPY